MIVLAHKGTARINFDFYGRMNVVLYEARLKNIFDFDDH